MNWPLTELCFWIFVKHMRFFCFLFWFYSLKEIANKYDDDQLLLMQFIYRYHHLSVMKYHGFIEEQLAMQLLIAFFR